MKMTKILVTIMVAAALCVFGYGCKSHDHPHGDHPHKDKSDHPKGDHPKSDHPKSDHPSH
ncbi:MAG: hypothetical protein CMJ18_09220 [Phycisphaeraceae bacterium]|nr:hypothetical protein [Phycisphaeraceae bacterium]